MRRVVEATTDGILVTDARNPRHQPIIYANPGFGRLIGCPVEELLGQTPRMMLGPQSDPAAIERVARAVDDREAVRVELICHRAERHAVLERHHAQPRVRRGRPADPLDRNQPLT